MPGLTYTIADLIRQQGQTQANALREQANLRARQQVASGQGWGQAIADIGHTIATIPAQQQQARAMAQQNELNALRIQNERGTLTDKELARQRDAAFTAELGKYDNIEEALPHLYKVDPNKASELAKHVMESKSEGLKFQEQILSTERAKADFISSKLSTEDPGQYTKNLHTLQVAMPDRDWSVFSGDPVKDKPAIQGLLQEAMTAKQRVDAQQKAIDDARMAAAQQSTELHQRKQEEAAAEAAKRAEAQQAAQNAIAAGHLAVARGQLGVAQAREQREATTAKAGGKLSATAIEKVAGIDQSLGVLSSLEKVVKPEWLGPVAGRYHSMQVGMPGVTVPDDLARFAAETATLKNSIVKAITGAQMSEPEAKRIMAQVPDFTDKPNVWQQKLKATRENMMTLKRRTIELSGGVDSSAPVQVQSVAPVKRNPFRK